MLAAAWLVGVVPTPFAVMYAGTSVLAVIVYAVDKSAARRDRRRTPESTLHMIAASGGWPGALLAQGLFRHKSTKPAFQRFFWATAAFNCVGMAWLLRANGVA